jgi:hypothetical protein
LAEAILRWIPAFAGMTVMFGNNGEITAFGCNSILFYRCGQIKMPVKIKGFGMEPPALSLGL